jgi:hypothetical protein
MDVCFEMEPELRTAGNVDHLKACHLEIQQVRKIKQAKGIPIGG